MISHIEIDGFKTFRNFSLELAPLQMIVGPNGAGKSNLFDALHLLAQLAGDADLRTAFQQLRGEAGNSLPSNRMGNGPTGCAWPWSCWWNQPCRIAGAPRQR